jgi:hypothetical protein
VKQISNYQIYLIALMFLNSIKKLTPVPPLFFLKRGGEEDILLPFSFLREGAGG